MIIKILGSVLIICSTTLLGYIYSNIDKYRILELSELEKAMSVLKSQIEFVAMPLPQAFFETASRVKPPASDIFKAVSNKIERKEGQTIKDIWCEAILESTKNTYLTKEDKEELCALGLTLGYLDKIRQQRSIMLFEEYIKETKSALKAKSLVSSKLYMSMGVLSGLIIAVVLI
ncbi:MAG: stage III sporulation protein AB [Lachnospiraceae bacterium]|nr:stage III sporulation protein AB [Lachnospiraceae bacterium]